MDPNNKNTINILTVLNWNADGIKAQRIQFIDFITRHNIDVACVSETHLNNAETFKIPGYIIYRKDRIADTASGGVAIMIKKRITHYPLPNQELTNIENVAIRLKMDNNSHVNLHCAYKQPKKRILNEDLQEIFQTTTPTLVIGDLNCKHTNWGCRVNNPNGIRLQDLTTIHGVQVSTTKEYTHYPYRPDHQPDKLLVVMQKNFSRPIYQKVHTELDSDHLPVTITFYSSPQIIPTFPKLINGKVDWELFQKQLDNNIKNPGKIHNTGNIDMAIKCYTEAIKNSIQDAVTPWKKKRLTSHETQPPAEIMNLIKLKNRIRRRWQNTRQLHLKTYTNQLTHRVRTELEKYRLSKYNKYVEELGTKDATMWQATKRLLRQPNIVHTLHVNDIQYPTDEEKTEVLAAHLEETFTINITADNPDQIKQIEEEIENYTNENPIEFEPTSPKEIKNYITKLPLKKAPGPDQITNDILKQLTKKSLAILATIFNACLRLGYFPNKWKLAYIVPFHKAGKDKHKPNSYRPISLLSTLSKLLEKVISIRLQTFLTYNNIIPQHQFGLKKKHSTTHQLLRLTEMIEKGYENKEYTVIAFIDLQNAFDKVWQDGLIYKIINLRIPKYLINIISSFLSNRIFAVRINATLSKKRTIKAGVPQGSILGPVLFNLYVHDLTTTENTEIALFADDTAIIAHNNILTEAVNHLQEALNSIYNQMVGSVVNQG